MKTYVTWVEMDRARVFKVATNGPELRVLRRHEIRHHTSREPENKKNCDKFFARIAYAIRDGEEILLMGPAITKGHFKAYLDAHDEVLSRCVVGSLTSDLASDAQLMARSREFFREYDVFGQTLPV